MLSWFFPVWQFIQTYWKGAAIAALTTAVSLVGISEILRIWNKLPDRTVSVAEEWNRSILRLGIVPVFPPEEDIQVGDVFAVIKADKRKQNSIESEASLNRSIKIYSKDLRELLQKKYDAMPLFPNTVGMKTTTAYWEHQGSANGIFRARSNTSSDTGPSTGSGTGNGTVSERQHLALAAFPSFTIKKEKSISGGVGFFGSLLGRSEDEDDTIEVKILGGETYGISSLEAEEQLRRICVEILQAVCSDKGLRAQLSHIAADLDAKNPGEDRAFFPYAIDVELILVNRVYLARSITQKSVRGRSSAGLFGISSPRETGGSPSGRSAAVATDKDPKDDIESPKPGPATTGAQREAASVSNSMAAGSGSVKSGANSDVNMEAVFQRPVVIGYRAVRMRFDQELPAEKNTPQPLGDWAP